MFVWLAMDCSARWFASRALFFIGGAVLWRRRADVSLFDFVAKGQRPRLRDLFCCAIRSARHLDNVIGGCSTWLWPATSASLFGGLPGMSWRSLPGQRARSVSKTRGGRVPRGRPSSCASGDSFVTSLWLARHLLTVLGCGVHVRTGLACASSGCRELAHIAQCAIPHLVLFLLAYWLYIDGVNTIIKMAVNYGMSLGLGHDSLLTALLLTQFVGFPAVRCCFGCLGDRIGPKRGILIGLVVYAGITVYAYFLDSRARVLSRWP